MKRLGHSRQVSVDRSLGVRGGSTGARAGTGAGAGAGGGAGAGAGTGANTTKGHHRKTSSVNSMNSNFLAEQYDRDRNNIIKHCFGSKLDPKTGKPAIEYFIHARVLEDSKYLSSRPAKDSSLTNKKKRVLIVSYNKLLQQVQLNKARENSDGSFQIGRTWFLKELECIERDEVVAEGFTMVMGKKYYWETNTAKERSFFIKTLVKIFMDHSNGHVPVLKNWDLKDFYLDEKSYKRAVIPLKNIKEDSSAIKKNNNNSNSSSSSISKSNVVPVNDTPNVVANSSSAAIAQPQVLQTTPYRSQNRYVSSVAGMTGTDESKQQQVQQVQQQPQVQQMQQQPQVQQVQQVQRMDSVNGKILEEKTKTNATVVKPNANIVTATTTTNINPVSNTVKKTEYTATSSNDNNKYEQQYRDKPSSKMDRSSEFPTLTEEPLEEASPEKPKHVSPVVEKTTAGPSLPSQQKTAEVISLHSTTDEDIDFNDYNNSNNNADDNAINYNSRNVESGGKNYETTAIPFEDAEIEPLNMGTDPFEEEDLNAAPETQNTTRVIENPKKPVVDLSFEKDDETAYSNTLNNSMAQKEKAAAFYDQPKLEKESTDLRKTDPREVTMTAAAAEEREVEQQPKDEDIFYGKESKPTEEDEEIMLAMLESVNWNPKVDNVDTLLKKLRIKMNEAQYSFNQELVNVSEVSAKKLSSSNISSSCDKIDPWLSSFSMELSSCSKDIEYVETQNNYLQVESANKKKLWIDLSQLLSDVSMDSSTINNIKTLSITEGNLTPLEMSLSKLHTAMNAIMGDQKTDSDHTSRSNYNYYDQDEYDDLSQMRALKERKTMYENVSKDFISRCYSILKNKILNNFSQNYDLNELNKILPYSSLTLFIKKMSLKDYSTLISLWNSSAQRVYEEKCGKVSLDIEQLLKSHTNEIRSSLASSAGSTNTFYKKTQETTGECADITIMDYQNVENILESWLEVKVNKQSSVSKQYTDSDLLRKVITSIEHIQSLCCTYQNFITKFFHITSNELQFNEYIEQVPLDKRSQNLKDLYDLESDRKIADLKYDLMSTVFSKTLKNFLNNLTSLVKTRAPSLAPGILLYIQTVTASNLKNSDQEFMMSFYQGFSERLIKNWDLFIKDQRFLLERVATTVMDSKIVSPVILSFSQFFFNLKQEMNFLFETFSSEINSNIANMVRSTTFLKPYRALSMSVLSLLSKYCESERYLQDSTLKSISSRKSKGAIENNATISSEVGSSTDSSGNSRLLSSLILDKTIFLLLNTHWLIESENLITSNSDNNYSGEEVDTDILMKKAKNIFDTQRELYSENSVKNLMPKLYLFVTNASKISEDYQQGNEHGDPSRYAAYSQSNLSKIVSVYTSRDMTELINRLYENMMTDFLEFQTSIGLLNGAKEFMEALYSKIWSNLQGYTVSFYLQLYFLVSKHYKNTEIKFTKNDIISAFTVCKAKFSTP